MLKQIKPKCDLLLIGALSGVAGVIIKDLLELLVLLFMPTFVTCPQFAAGIIFSPQQAKSSMLPLIGLEIDTGVSIIVGIIVVVALFRVGYDFWKVKGITIGLLAWIIIEITLTKYLSSISTPTSVLALEISLLIHFGYGLTVVGVQRLFLKRKNK